MQLAIEILSVIAALALLVQVGVLIVLFLQLKRTTESINKMVTDLHDRMGPILARTQILLDDTQPRITNLVEDAAHIVYLARAQAQKMDRVFSEASDRLRGQMIKADRILSGAMEAVEEAGTQVRRSFLGPMQKASALVHGIKIGLDMLRSRRGEPRTVPEVSEQEDELFI